MKCFSFGFLRLTQTVTAALLALALVAAEAQAAPFRASGTDETTFFRGKQIEGLSSGQARPGGQFDGVWSGELKGHTASGVEIWDFGAGHTLTWFFLVEPGGAGAPSVGIYIIIDGEGRFEGASGSADYFRIGHGDGTGEWILEGTISQLPGGRAGRVSRLVLDL